MLGTMTELAPPPRDLDSLGADARHVGLAVLGAFHPEAGAAHLPLGTRTVVLLGPDAHEFWPRFLAAPEVTDGAPHPLDRWSRRTVGRLACQLGAKARFPFTGPPWLPFIDWAKRAGMASSPIGMLVHPEAGLWVSIRGALALKEALSLPAPGPCPCLSCSDRPCLSACPVQAFRAESYDTAACHAHLDTPPGTACLDQGCAARRACPVSQGYPRDPAQSAFHMRAFHWTP